MSGKLGFFNYLRRFAQGLSKVCLDLQNVVQTGSVTPAAIESFGVAKNLLLKFFLDDGKLHIPNPKKRLYIATDASAKALGAMLYQLADEELTKHHGDNVEIVAFMSRTLSSAEQKYADVLISGRTGFQSNLTESLAIVWALEECADIVDYVDHTTVLTDHRNITFLRDRDRGMLFR